jgi:hypothetical protein
LDLQSAADAVDPNPQQSPDQSAQELGRVDDVRPTDADPPPGVIQEGFGL